MLIFPKGILRPREGKGFLPSLTAVQCRVRATRECTPVPLVTGTTHTSHTQTPAGLQTGKWIKTEDDEEKARTEGT